MYYWLADTPHGWLSKRNKKTNSIKLLYSKARQSFSSRILEKILYSKAFRNTPNQILSTSCTNQMCFCNENDTHKKRLNLSPMHLIYQSWLKQTHITILTNSVPLDTYNTDHITMLRVSGDLVLSLNFTKERQRSQKSVPSNSSVESPKNKILLRIIIYVVLAYCYQSVNEADLLEF